MHAFTNMYRIIQAASLQSFQGHAEALLYAPHMAYYISLLTTSLIMRFIPYRKYLYRNSGLALIFSVPFFLHDIKSCEQITVDFDHKILRKILFRARGMTSKCRTRFVKLVFR